MARNLVRTAFQILQAFPEGKVARLFEQSSLRSKVQNFSYCFKNAFFSSTEDMMTMFNLIDDGAQLPPVVMESYTRVPRIGWQSVAKGRSRSCVRNLMDREVALKMKLRQ